jgi:antirestriction protein ArdC
VRAASQASKAADYLLGFVSETTPGAAKEAIMGDHEAA